MIGRLRGYLMIAFVIALSFSLSTRIASGAAAKSKMGEKERPTSSRPKGGSPSLTTPKVPEAGQSAMIWPGLNLAGQIGSLAGNAGADIESIWRPVTAPGMKAPAPSNARTVCDLLEGWTFIPIGLGTSQPEKPRAASLPERWADDRDYCAGWYARQVQLAPREGERLIARFEQVQLFCILYVNGVECGRHLGGYTPFEFDITQGAKDGNNLLALYVHDASAALGNGKAYNQISSFMPSTISQKAPPKNLKNRKDRLMGGAWGGVSLERRPTACVGNVFVKTSTRRHEMTVECELENPGAQPQSAKIDFELLNWPDGSPVSLAIPSRQASLSPGKMEKITVTVPWPDPRLWSPDHPNLYVLRTTLKTSSNKSDSSDRSDCLDIRFGFREFWAEGQQFMLNGVPIRLRGESHYGLGRTDKAADPVKGRDWNREQFFALKERYRGNAARLSAQIMPGNVALAADEAGYLLIDQSSIWTLVLWWYRKAGEPFLANTRREFAEWIRRDRNSPSVVIWDVENEVLRMGKENKPWVKRLEAFARENDDTRLIECSGAGWYDKTMQIAHLHDEQQFAGVMEKWRASDNHPLIMGEFWVGFQGGEFRITSSLEYRSRPDYRLEEARLYEEEFLQMRNFGVSGVMPFQVARAMPPAAKDGQATPLDAKSKECVRAVHHGLQALTVFFWPRVVSAAAGGELKRELVVCNDSETARDLTAEWSIEGAAPQKAEMKLAPGAQRRIPVSFVTPAKDCRLVARLLAGGKVEASEELNIRVADARRLSPPALKRQVIVYEGAKPGAVEKLQELGVAATASKEVPANPNEALWVIAPGATDATLNAQSRKIREYLEAGGRVLCLAQEQWPRWSPVRLGFATALRATPWYYLDLGIPKATKESLYSCYAPIYAAGHPAFEGITESDLRLWSPRDGRVSDDALVRPAATKTLSSGGWRILAGACRPEMASMAEARVGKGTLVFCQAQVLEQSQTHEARLVLMNLLRYLDGAAWSSGSGRVALAGALTAAKASALTGARAEAFAGASPERGDVLIATDGADPAELEKWADAGGTVLVLSGEVARRLPDYAVTNDESLYYVGAYGQGHPLLWGVSLQSFMGVDHPCVEGVLTKVPASGEVLLHGLSAQTGAVRGGVSEKGVQQVNMFDAAAGPVAVAQPRGKGQWIVATMAPWRGQTLYDGELMRTLLANAGVAIPTGQKESAVQVLKTVPLKIDGQLNDWTSDMEDRNVSQYVHAQPIVLSSEDATGGKLRNDADLSAIVYFLWNEKTLSMAGVVFGQGATTSTVSARLNDHVLTIIPSGEGASVQLDGKPAAALRAASGRLASYELADARALSLFEGSAPRADAMNERVPGATFEIEAPWSALGWAKPPDKFQGLIRVERADGAAIQSPAAAAPNDPNTWLTLAP